MCMKKFLLIAFIFCFQLSYAQEPGYVYISAEGLYKLTRVNFGATQFELTPKDSATKMAYGIHLSNEVKIVSGFIGKYSPVAVHDAFYVDLNLGWMNTEPATYKQETESRFAMTTNMGYLGLVGYRNKRWGALGGVDFRWRSSFIGGISMPNLDGDLLYFSRPIVLRGEYNLSKENRRRLIITGWHDGGSKTRAAYQSIRAELGLGEKNRWWLMAQYTQQTALGENHFLLHPPTDVTFRQYTLGFRIGILP